MILDAAIKSETYSQKWRRLHPEYEKRYYQNNRERMIARAKSHRIAHPEQTKALKKQWYADKREERLAYAKAYRKEHRLKIKAWKQKNRDKIAVYTQKYYQENPDKFDGYAKKFRIKHPGASIAAYQKRRALKKAATINLAGISQWIHSVRSKPFAICYYCQKKVSTKGVHIDHIIALSKGGAHSVENLCVACAYCNQSKNAKAIAEWIKIGQQIFPL